MSRSLEASLVFNDATAATETLAMLGKQGQFAVAEVLDAQGKRFAHWSWNPNDNPDALGPGQPPVIPTPAVRPFYTTVMLLVKCVLLRATA